MISNFSANHHIQYVKLQLNLHKKDIPSRWNSAKDKLHKAADET